MRRAFTIIELLVVIVIIGIIASMIFLVFNSVRGKSRDTKRITDIRQIQSALEMYKNDNNVYPETITFGESLIGPNNQTYMTKVPSSPNKLDGACSSDTYIYQTTDPNTTYNITYCLGSAVQNITAGNCTAVPGNICALTAINTSATAKVLVVAGGGGGGAAYGGGGGGGGVIQDNNFSIAIGEFPVTVGIGGSGGPAVSANNRASNGTNSIFSTLTAIGGGGGVGYLPYNAIGSAGGSGGGGLLGGTGGLGTPSQGNAGGTGSGAANYGGGGGGGGGAVGENGIVSRAGGGGIGVSSDILGSATYYSGGGGGSTWETGPNNVPGLGGQGGGGDGGDSVHRAGYDGIPNTGGGGGGSVFISGTYKGGNGASGRVIISYTTGSIFATGGEISISGTNTIHTFNSSGSFVVTAMSATNPSADLSNLALSGSPTNYTFAGGTYLYNSLTVNNAVSSINVTPTGAGIITVEGIQVVSGQTSANIPLTTGVEKTITIIVLETGKLAKVYTVKVTRNNIQATPTFDPPPGAISFGTTVIISSAGADAIYYTTDGSTPTITSTNQAVTPLVINSAVTVKALAVKTGYGDSAIATAIFSNGRIVKVLVVAGGGGGGAAYGGGGGGGGYIYNASHAVINLAYTVTVGNGGAGSPAINNNNRASNGGDSVFSSITAVGGGGGVGYLPMNVVGSAGGSGGGGTLGGAGGAGTSGQGNAGGIGNGQPNYGSGGGGGAGTTGYNGGTGKAGDGGTGISSDISGSAVYYAGGGGGSCWHTGNLPGAGGTGGGGGGSDAHPEGYNGVTNRGGGGGGSLYTSTTFKGGDGGSGIVIIRYATANFGACTGGTITTDGSDTIHTFTSSGTFTVY